MVWHGAVECQAIVAPQSQWLTEPLSREPYIDRSQLHSSPEATATPRLDKNAAAARNRIATKRKARPKPRREGRTMTP